MPIKALKITRIIFTAKFSETDHLHTLEENQLDFRTRKAQ